MPLTLHNNDHTNSVQTFVTREQELSSLNSFLNKFLSGKGQIAFVIGEAGRGKTVLLHAFAQESLAAHEGLVTVYGNCSAITGLGDPYLPFRQVLEQLLGDVESQWLEETIDKEQALRLWELLPTATEVLLENGLELLDTLVSSQSLLARAKILASHHVDWVTRLENVLTEKKTKSIFVSPQQIQLFKQYTDVIHALSKHVPILILLDDLQWADETSINLLFYFGRRLKNNRVMIAGAYRPVEVATGRGNNRHPLEPVVGEFKNEFGDIILDLSQAEGMNFINSFLDQEDNLLSSQFRNRLFKQTQGHPLFTSELLQEMKERGDIFLNDSGCWVEGKTLNWESLPIRVEGAISERIKRLAEPLQDVLRVASVEGEIFTAEVIAQVLEKDERRTIRQLSKDLSRTHRLVHSQGVKWLNQSRVSPYRFHHYLIQQYLYKSLDEIERSYLHEAIANKFELLYAVDEGNEYSILLAYHFEKAGVLSKAIHYFTQAGQQAARRSANQEAINNYEIALKLLRKLQETTERNQNELNILVAFGSLQIAIKGYSVSEVEKTYSRAWELCQSLISTPDLMSVLFGLWGYFQASGDVEQAQKLSKSAMERAEESQQVSWLLGAYCIRGATLFFLGEFSLAEKALSQGISLYDPEKHSNLAYSYGNDPGLFSLSYNAFCLTLQGYSDQALDHSTYAVQLGRSYSNPYDEMVALFFRAMVYHMQRNVRSTLEDSEHALKLSRKYGFLLWITQAEFLYGWALAHQGEIKKGLEYITKSVAAYQAIGARVGHSHWLWILAEVYMISGLYEEASAKLNEAMDFLENGSFFWEAEIYRLKGELQWASSKPIEEVETSFQKAIATAQKQKAKLLELRAKYSLSRIYWELDRKQEAEQMLTGIYSQFTEGFDTPDLVLAKKVLDMGF